MRGKAFEELEYFEKRRKIGINLSFEKKKEKKR